MATNIHFPPDSTLYADVILNGGAGAPADLADGELYIDEAGRTLYVETDVGIQPIPLDIGYVPRRPSGLPRTHVLLKTDGGSDWGPLSAGGGNQPFDVAEYRIPGLAPTALGTLSLPAASGGIALLEVSQPKTLLGLRVFASGGSGTVTFTLHKYDGTLGEIVTTQVLTFPTAGEQLVSLNLPLDPGLYAWTWTSANTVSLQTFNGNLTWTPTTQTHPVAMKF